MKQITKISTLLLSAHKHRFRDLMAFCMSFALCAGCFANPVIGNVGAGNVSIQQSADTTTINQSSQKAVINWQSFNINKNESTHFQQPAGGIILNRIDPNQGVSSIYGKLTSTGQIILSNPAGIYFGPSAFVNVGGLIATTGHLSDRDFLNGQYHFTNNPAYSGAIVNEGQIIAAQHGLIALVAPGVINNGLIQAKLGHVVLASGNAFTLNFAGNDLISFNIDEKTLSRGVDRNGNVLPDGVKNTGRIMANGGSVLITAAAAQGVLDHVINIEGIVSAKSVYQHNGQIIISGSPNSGVVRIAGKLNASGKHRNQQGGTVTVTGQNILLDNGALIDVSGEMGGGNIFIGGNYHGAGPLPNADAVVMAPSAVLNASAIRAGNGGNIILWSQNATKAYGTILAQGGSDSGNGGFIETSSHNFLDIAGMKVNLTAPHGTTGTWLLDPRDVYITTSATSGGAFGGGNPNVFTPTADNSNILNTDIQTNLAAANVTITTGATGTQNGDIYVNAPITWASANTLLLQAANNIFINNTITGAAGTLQLSALAANQSMTTGASGVISVANLAIQQGMLNLGSTGALGSTAAISITSGASLNAGFTGTLVNTATIQAPGTGVGGVGVITSTSAGTATLNNNIVLSGGSTFGGTGGLTLSGVISGTGGLTKITSGVLTLTNNNTYTGGTTVSNNGILATNNNNSFGAAGTSITLDNGTLKIPTMISAYTNNRPIVLGAGGGTFDSNGNGWIIQPIVPTFSGLISGTGSLTFINSAGGPSNITLTNNNTYSGGTIIQGGSVGTLGNNTTFGSGTITVPNGASFAGIRATGGFISFTTNPVNLNGDITIGRLTNVNDVTLGNNVTIFLDNPDGVMSTNTAVSSGIVGTISGPYGFTLTNGPSFGAGAGAFGLSGNNTYSGVTSVTGGTLQLQNINALGNTSAVNISPNAQLNVIVSGTITNSSPWTINGTGTTAGGNLGVLNVISTITSVLNSPITLASDSSLGGGGTMTLNGVISGTGNLSKIGTGTYSFGGTNTYSGTTTVSAGTLRLSSFGALGNTPSVSVVNGTTLDFNYNNGTLINNAPISLIGTGVSNLGAITATGSNMISNNNIIMTGNSTFGGTGSINLTNTISGNFNLNKVATGTYIFSGNNTYSGTTTVSAGTLSLGSVGALGNTSSTTVASGAALDFNYSGTLTNVSNISIASTGVGATGAITATGSNMIANNNVTMTSNSRIGGTGSLRLNGILGGAFNLTKVGTGQITLAGANTYSGGTSILAGILSLGSIGALGNSVSTSAFGGTLDFNYNGTLTNTSNIVIAGTGAGGLGAITATGNNMVANNNIFMVANSTIGGNGSLQLNGIVSGAFNLTKLGTGTLTLNGANSYSGTTTINAGTLSLASIGALGNTTSTTMANGTMLNMNYVGTLTNANPISLGGTGVTGGGALTGTAVGSVANNPITLSADSLFTIPGTLTLNGTLNGAQALSIAGAGTLTVGGNVGNTTPLTSILSNTNLQVTNTPTIITQNNQTYNNLVTLLSPATFSMVGSGSNDMHFNGLAGNNNLTLTSSAAGNYNYFINGPVSLANINVAPNAASSNNSLHLNNVGVQNWNVNNTDLGIINIGGVSGTFNFSNISSAYAGTDATSNFVFAANTGHISKLIDGGSLANLNTLDHSAFTQSVVYNLVGDIFNGNFNDGIGTTTFNHFNNIAARGANNDTLFANTIYLPNKSGNTVTVSSLNHGFINDPLYYDGIKTFVSLTGQDKAVFQITAILRAYGANSFIANINGVDMYFINFPFAQASGSITPPVSPIINSSLIGPTTNQDAQMNYFSQLQAINVIQGLEQFNRFSWNDTPAKFLFGADCSKLSGSGCCTGKYCQSSCVWQRD